MSKDDANKDDYLEKHNKEYKINKDTNSSVVDDDTESNAIVKGGTIETNHHHSNTIQKNQSLDKNDDNTLAESLRNSYRRRRAAISRHISHDFGKDKIDVFGKSTEKDSSALNKRQSKTLKNFIKTGPELKKEDNSESKYCPIININQIKHNNSNSNSSSSSKPVSPLDLPLNHEKKTISRTVSMKQSKISGNPRDGLNDVRRTKTKIMDKNEFIYDFTDKKKNIEKEENKMVTDTEAISNENREKNVFKKKTIKKSVSTMELKGNLVELKEVKRTPTLPSILPSSSSLITKKTGDNISNENTREHGSKKEIERLNKIDRKDTANMYFRNYNNYSQKKKENMIQRTETHFIDIESKNHETAASSFKSSSKSLFKNKFSRKKSGFGLKSKDDDDDEELKPLTMWHIILHFIILIFVEHPFKFHKQWKERMYKTGQLKNHKKNESIDSQTLSNVKEDELKAFKRTDTSRKKDFVTRNKRKTKFERDEDIKDYGFQSGTSSSMSRKRVSQVSFDFGNSSKKTFGNDCNRSNGNDEMISRPPKGYLPRCNHISRNKNDEIDKMNSDLNIKKSKKKSLEIFGDVLTAIGFNNTIKNNKFGWIQGLSNMNAKELSGFQSRLHKFIKKQHKGRIARALDHFRHPLTSMQRKHRRSHNKVRLLNAIEKHKAHSYDSMRSMVLNKAFLFGQWIFEGLSAPKYSKKPMLYTIIFPFVLIVFFAFMAGEYSLWTQVNEGKFNYTFGPSEFFKWFSESEVWRTFDDEFLVLWGARYLPKVTNEQWRWTFSLFIHENFAHLSGNVLLFVILSWSLESKYGFWRTTIVGFLSGYAGNFLSTCTEDPCGIVLGASGCIFGLAAFYIVDLVGRFKTISFPCLRLIGIVIFLFTFIIAFVSKNQSSNMSHLGGFIMGCGLGLGLVPRFFDERLEAILPLISLMTIISLLLIMPTYIYTSIIVSLNCPSIISNS